MRFVTLVAILTATLPTTGQAQEYLNSLLLTRQTIEDHLNGQTPSTPCGTSQEGDADPKVSLVPDSLERPSSYARILQDSAINGPLLDDLGKECSERLGKIYSSGQTLKVQALYDQSKPVADYPFASGGSPTDFFHFTDSQSMIDHFHPEIADRKAAHVRALADGTYDEEFIFLRKRKTNSIYWKALFLAEDPISSAGYGKFKVTIHLNPNARILPKGIYWTPEAKRELEGRYPGIFIACDEIPLIYFAAEDSGVDLLDYKWNRAWFQLIRPSAIERVELSQ